MIRQAIVQLGFSLTELQFLEALGRAIARDGGRVCLADAYQEVFPDCKRESAVASASRLLRRLVQKGALDYLLEQSGLGIGCVIAQLRECMNAKDHEKVYLPDGEWDIVSSPNWPVRHQAVRLAARLHGLVEERAGQVTNGRGDGQMTFTDYVEQLANARGNGSNGEGQVPAESEGFPS